MIQIKSRNRCKRRSCGNSGKSGKGGSQERKNMRLNKYIAHSGVCSRRKADELIQQGKVTVNGLQAECGYDVAEGDVVSVDGRTIRPEKRLVYYILNKPTGYITTADDEQGRPTVLDLMPDISERIYPVGRLDFNTSGMLIMTNDGDLAYKLTSPHKNIFKTYVAEVTGLFLHRDAAKLRKGVDIGGYVTKPAEVEILRQGSDTTLVEIRIAEGKNRQVRKMFEASGHKVIHLRRTAIGDLKMAHLREGMYRKMTVNELEYLKRL